MPTVPASLNEDTPASTRSMRDVAQNAVSADTLIDIVQRLGLVDIVVNRLRARVESTDVDELIDGATNYFRRHPEMVVVGLGTLTVAAAAVVFLTERDEDEVEVRSTSRARTSRSQRDDIDMTPAVGRTMPVSPAPVTPRTRNTASSRRNTARE